MTGNAQRFIQANVFSPVVYASAVPIKHHIQPGMLYRLANNKAFTLSPIECRLVTPRWIYEEAA